VVVSFIGGGNRREPLTLHKSLTVRLYPILLYQVHLNISGNQTRNVSAVMSLKTGSRRFLPVIVLSLSAIFK
jgi:hypothetical protein